jgi:hypothetical protein
MRQLSLSFFETLDLVAGDSDVFSEEFLRKIAEEREGAGGQETVDELQGEEYESGYYQGYYLEDDRLFAEDGAEQP